LKSIFAAIACASILGGCTTIGPNFVPIEAKNPSQGVLYIYRPETSSLSVLSAVFSIDGEKVVTLENNGFAALAIPAGQYRIGQEWKAGLIGNSNLEGMPVFTTAKVSAGGATYIRLLAGARSQSTGIAYNNIGINFSWRLEVIPESTAFEEIKLTKGAEIQLKH
jgi:hypothetical protein